MKHKAKDGGKQSKSEPLPVFADVLTLAERQELSDLWEEAAAILTPKERARERELTSRLGTENELNERERDDLAAINRKAWRGRQRVNVRRAWMVYAKSEHWQHLKRLPVWRLSTACFMVEGIALGELLLEGWAFPHHMDPRVVGPRLIWDFAVAAIKAGDLWATPNGETRVNQEYGLVGGWNYRRETVPDYDVRPAELLALPQEGGFYLVPELESLLPVPSRPSRDSTTKAAVQL